MRTSLVDRGLTWVQTGTTPADADSLAAVVDSIEPLSYELDLQTLGEQERCYRVATRRGHDPPHRDDLGVVPRDERETRITGRVAILARWSPSGTPSSPRSGFLSSTRFRSRSRSEAPFTRAGRQRWEASTLKGVSCGRLLMNRSVSANRNAIERPSNWVSPAVLSWPSKSSSRQSALPNAL